jgi:hypothetical protein
MPRIQAIILPILREAFPDVNVQTWGADIDYRQFPILNLRRVGGVRNFTRPNLLDKGVVEMTAYTAVGLPETEQLYLDALEVLYQAVKTQKQTEAGYLHSMKETMGMTQFSSLYMDSWRVQGLIQFGARPRTSLIQARSTNATE